MQLNLLTDDEFKATFAEPMRDVIEETTDVINVWPYVASVPARDLCGHVVWSRFVEHVYRTPDDRYDHVLVMTQTKNVYLVVVVDLCAESIFGHHLLDLRREYGLLEDQV